MKRIEYIIIDPQIGFCSQDSTTHPLSVPNADKDMERVAILIEKAGSRIFRIHLTLDMHQYMHISHHVFWKTSDGKELPPFTEVKLSQVKSGEILPKRLDLLGKVVEYLEALEAKGRYPHMGWPVHCNVLDSVKNESAIFEAAGVGASPEAAIDTGFLIAFGISNPPSSEIYSRTCCIASG